MEVSNPNDIACPNILRSAEGECRMRHGRIGVKIVMPILLLLSNPDAFAYPQLHRDRCDMHRQQRL